MKGVIPSICPMDASREAVNWGISKLNLAPLPDCFAGRRKSVDSAKGSTPFSSFFQYSICLFQSFLSFRARCQLAKSSMLNLTSGSTGVRLSTKAL